MTENQSSTQQAILLATIDCINEHGLENLTTRMIAEQAGANIASINYYFRTKEILVNQALEITINHMLEDVVETLENQELDFRQILHDVIYYLISGASDNPGVSSAHLYRFVIEKDYQSVSATSFIKAFDRVQEKAEVEFPDQDPEKLRLILASIFSSIMFMMLTPLFFDLKEDNLSGDEPTHRRLAEHFTDLFYAAVEE